MPIISEGSPSKDQPMACWGRAPAGNVSAFDIRCEMRWVARTEDSDAAFCARTLDSEVVGAAFIVEVKVT